MGDRTADPSAFVRLLTQSHEEVLRYVLALVPDAGEAQEVLQDTAVALWQKFGDYDPAQPFVPWACRFAWNHVLKHRHRQTVQGRTLSLEALEAVAQERLEQESVLQERREALSHCLETLSPEQRRLVELRYVKRTPIREVARETGQSVHVLYGALERVRRALFLCVNGALGAEGRP
jgi:RNA polymerase sigma-70 factor (ECF subfamily)